MIMQNTLDPIVSFLSEDITICHRNCLQLFSEVFVMKCSLNSNAKYLLRYKGLALRRNKYKKTGFNNVSWEHYHKSGATPWHHSCPLGCLILTKVGWLSVMSSWLLSYQNECHTCNTRRKTKIVGGIPSVCP